MNEPQAFKSWQIFILERFSPLRHFALICCFFGANAFMALGTSTAAIKSLVITFIAIISAFFRLRLFDEIKDYETDREMNPDRPLARRLIPLAEAKTVGFSLAMVELALAALLGKAVFIAASLYISYSFLMYREFFLSAWLKPRFVLYALIHTPVSSLMSLFIFSALTGQCVFEVPKSFFLFMFANWMIFNVFEFGRKTFGREEEREGVDSYSKRFGPLGAVTSVIAMALMAEAAAVKLGLHFTFLPFLAITTYLLATAGGYVWANSAKTAAAFRGACSVFILLYNLIIFSGFILCKL